jgi:membrane protein implicated in regulation of membrane protease activity
MDATFFFYGWLVVGLLFFISEIGAPGLFFFISGGIGSFVTALFAYFGFSFYTQACVWTCVSVISFFCLRFFVTWSKSNHHKTNVQALIGQKARVTQRIDINGVGYVKVRGEEWVAITHHENGLEVDTMVVVVGFSGNKLIVRP